MHQEEMRTAMPGSYKAYKTQGLTQTERISEILRHLKACQKDSAVKIPISDAELARMMRAALAIMQESWSEKVDPGVPF